ncbi:MULTISPECIES: low temperature requirement protein A [unclassified Microbacterium]|uniref:low temperature requirement protein A n=1 Tax=unclassified Microbacterium TaxID=2609290 RepID=UPI0021A49EF3|nr:MULTISPECIES: low temperature requirement protein A [unclassified Microbacterium]MCT1364762.1 low temperature requirement protein A [Microbacterium sp. p3-SID131]MCT1376155.1 low temperature requirement protein A [Microbacterium sp. p3-SID337]
MTAHPTSSPRFRLQPMRPRDPGQPHRAASPLELFFDLVFVVAVSIASAQLHHALSHGDFLHGITSYAMLFFAIWWAWMNFTWFATSFDTDDWPYRIATFVQMAGVLILAAGIPGAFEEGDFTLPVVGYVVMRIAMVAQWLRASRNEGPLRRVALRYALGVAVVQVLWLLFLLIPSGPVQLAAFVVFALIEITVPVFAERRHQTPWHPHHITERYGLFTLIVLGESLLASANAIIDALDEVEALGPLLAISALAFVVTAALWWIYFWPPHHRAITTLGRSLRYGYTHYFVFAAAAAFSAGIEVELDVMTGESHLAPVAATFTVSIPIAVFLIGIWWVAIRDNADRVVNTVIPVGALLVLLDPFVPVPVALTAAVMVGIVAVLVMRPPIPRGAAATDA